MSYPHLFATGGIGDHFHQVDDEVQRQFVKWGQQDYPDGTSAEQYQIMSDLTKVECELAAERGEQTWLKVAMEEMYEIACEEDDDRLDVEIDQLAAVLANWKLSRAARRNRVKPGS